MNSPFFNPLTADSITPSELKALLDRYVAEYNVPSFADSDPVRFARRFDSLPDREIVSLLVSTISWGRRPMILRNAEKIIDILEGQPLNFVLEGPIDSVGEENIHRTFFGRHLRYYLRGLRELYRKYGTLENFGRHVGIHRPGVESPWVLASELSRLLSMANESVEPRCQEPDRCLPSKPETSALKRLNMALRWLVRDDGIVDPGGWTLLKPSQLFIPMDVHVVNTSRSLGLLPEKLKTPDRRSAVALTDVLRSFNPDDPTVYDFALFGIGVNNALPSSNS